MSYQTHFSLALLLWTSSACWAFPQAHQELVVEKYKDPQQLERSGIQAEKSGDFQQARQFYKEACRLDAEWNEDGSWPFGHASVLYRYGRLLRTGKGGPVDKLKAAQCFVLALGIGSGYRSASAWVELIEMYATGDGIPKDLRFAKHLKDEFRGIADNVGWSKEDHLIILSLLLKGEILPRDLLAASNRYYCIGEKEKALQLVLQAVSEGDPRAAERLGASYKGIGWSITEKDDKKSDFYFDLSNKLRKTHPLSKAELDKRKGKGWSGDLGPPEDDADGLQTEEFHRAKSQDTADSVRALYHRLWAERLTPRC